MDFASILERFGDRWVLAAGGLVIGAWFGFFAQRARFCLRAAVAAAQSKLGVAKVGKSGKP